MNIEAFLLCDAATDQQGKLNVLGAFDNIYAKGLPAVHPACVVAARIRFEKVEAGEHTVRVHVIVQDGKEIIPRLDGKVSVRVADDLDSGVINLLLHLRGLKFESYGQYRIDLALDGKIAGSLPLHVREMPREA